MTPELKPCPFCGGKVDPRGWYNGLGEHGPECRGCGATAPSIEAWNTRPLESQARAEALEEAAVRGCVAQMDNRDVGIAILALLKEQP